MAGRRNRSRRRRLRANLGSGNSESSSPQSSGSSYDRAAQCKTPLPNRQQQVTEKKPDLPRTTRDARAVRPFLLGLICGYYIDAISRLPAAELRTTLARGLLVGGHCYGPLHPVHNIILNSVWYAAAFPFRADPIHVDAVSTEGNCYACTRRKTKMDHPKGEEHFGGHPHKTGESETEDDRDCPTLIDLVKWFADRIDCAAQSCGLSQIPLC
ncbi:unnamed protein product [Miscanthus lutarioriparius]|uniref:PIR2-like helical domain-containing protein n=1 Tax=Miscanthus lutarioriparius TaxID=422564 RepID=A0A811QTR8_9POAL|nr:unnamed protein product [Miscanthus lutarioriparius]